MHENLQVGPYRLLKRIAVGGMGEVFLAEVEGPYFTRQVALKRMLPDLMHDIQHVNRFIDEARLMTQLHHGNILSVHELKQDDWGLYMVMEYIPSVDVRTINRLLHQQKKVWPAPYAAWVIAEICEALDYAHNKVNAQGQALDIIHRDISPSNILVGLAGEVKLIDFGVAQAQGSLHQSVMGTLQGKLNYLSPEQAKGLKVNAQSDLYAISLILYEMLSGVRALEANSDVEALNKAQSAQITPISTLTLEHAMLSIDPALCEIVQQGLAINLSERTPNASVMAHQLKEWSQQQNHAQQATTLTQQLKAWLKELMATNEQQVVQSLNLNQALQMISQEQKLAYSSEDVSGIRNEYIEKHGEEQETKQLEEQEKKPLDDQANILSVREGDRITESIIPDSSQHTVSIVVQPPLLFTPPSASEFTSPSASEFTPPSASEFTPKINADELIQEDMPSSHPTPSSFAAIWSEQLQNQHDIDPSQVQIDASLHVSADEIDILSTDILSPTHTSSHASLSHDISLHDSPSLAESTHHTSMIHRIFPQHFSWKQKLYWFIVVGIMTTAFIWSQFKVVSKPLAVIFYDTNQVPIVSSIQKDLVLSIDQKTWTWDERWSNRHPLQVCVTHHQYDQCQWIQIQKLPLVQSLTSNEQQHIFQWPPSSQLDSSVEKLISEAHVLRINLKPKSTWLPQLKSTHELYTNDASISFTNQGVNQNKVEPSSIDTVTNIPTNTATNTLKNTPKNTAENKESTNHNKRKAMSPTRSKANHYILITSTPTHATLHCKNLKSQKLPYRLPKKQNIACSVQAPHYQTVSLPRKIRRTKYHAALLELATITIRALPRSAKLYINNQAVSNPIKNYSLPKGTHQIKASITYQNKEKYKYLTIDLKAKQKITRVIDLSDLLFDSQEKK